MVATVSRGRTASAVDVVDSTWIGARPASVAAVIAQPRSWRGWWPRLDLAVDELRGEQGVRWRVRAGERGRVTGSMEVWLEPALDGVVAHYFLRLAAAPGRRLSARAAGRIARRYRTRAKRLFGAVGDQLDPARLDRVRAP
jgi:hypothetical protein